MPALRLFAIIMLLILSGCSNQTGSNSTNPAASTQFVGCYSPGMSSTAQCGVLPSFGNPAVDTAFAQEIAIQQSFWGGIPASPSPFNDCQSQNAISLPGGTILFGVNLFQKIFVQNNGDTLPIAGVLAHEWGHQVQFDNGWMVQAQPTARPTELEADAFSGYYMALAKGWAWAFISDYFSTLASFGDYDFTDPSHHGTPQERVAAGNLGFTTGLSVLQTGQVLSYSQLHQIFVAGIGSFARGTITVPANADSQVRSVLESIDSTEMREILAGRSRGKNRVPPVVDDREGLFPSALK